jgi:hypothetical protein
VGDTITVTPGAARVEDWTIVLEMAGVPTRSPGGAARSAEEPYRFEYSRFDANPDWEVKVHAWTDSTHPLEKRAAFDSLLRGERGEPIVTRRTRRLDYVWYRPTIAGWPRERAGVMATTDVELPPGGYVLRTISDDGIRVSVDGRVVIEDWSIHESRVLEVPIAAGRHRIAIAYFQRDGWTELRAEIIKARR